MIQIGEFEIHIINDARTMGDSGGMFGLVPRALWSRYYTPDDLGRVAVHHHCLLVRGAGKTILVDTGYGTKIDGKMIRNLELTRPVGGLVAGLAEHGVAPGDVDLVIDTHLHNDHCGGNTRFEGDQVIPVFPNAEYWVQRLEYADAAFPNERTRATYLSDNFAPLLASGQMRLLNGETGVLPGMRCVVTPGHTRGHQSLVFESGGRAAMFVCDMASFAVHFARLAWMTAFDVEPLITLETKRTWQRWALANDALILFMHDALIPVGRLVEQDGKLEVIAADET